MSNRKSHPAKAYFDPRIANDEGLISTERRKSKTLTPITQASPSAGACARFSVTVLSWFSFLLLFAFLLALFLRPTPAYADDPIFDEFPAWLPVDENEPLSIAWGDVDGDGDLDLAVGNIGQNRLYENQDGELEITASWSSDDSEATESIAWGDMDGDGDLDLAVGNKNQPCRVYENVGGVLDTIADWSAPVSDTTRSIAWGDVNGDGAPDLAVGNEGQNRVYHNTGTTLESSATWTSVETDTTTSLVWGDINNDGDLDLVAGNQNEPNVMYENLGDSLVASWHSAESDPTQSVALGDMDEDGDLDLIAGNGVEDTGAPNRLYYNVGGELQAEPGWSSIDSYPTFSVAWGDMDGDGDLDLAVGNVGSLNAVYENVDGILDQMPYWISGELGTCHSVTWADIDGDGNLDLATANTSEPIKVYENSDTVLEATPIWSSAISNTTTSVAWGDVDGDADLDLAVGNNGQPNRLYVNNNGTLESTFTWMAPISETTTSVAWGDVDGDGDLDLAVGNNGQVNRVYEYDNGSLESIASWVSDSADATQSVAWGDVDGDGDLDLAVGNEGQANKVYTNNGGTLESIASWNLGDDDWTQSVVWGDVDGDGDLDLAVGNEGQATRLYENVNGVLATTAGWSSSTVATTSDIAWGDVDGDGDLDLAVANAFFPNQLYENVNGALATSAVWMSIDSAWTHAVAWGDMDGDGDLDLMTGGDNGTVVYENDGGELPDQGASVTMYSSDRDIAWGDVDGDGDLDLAVGTSGQQNMLLLNTRNVRVSQTTVPWVALPPFAYQADFYGMAEVISESTVPITYTLRYPDGYPPASVEAMFSLNGGGQWLSAEPAADTTTTGTEVVTTAVVVNQRPFTDDLATSAIISDGPPVESTLNLTPTDIIVDLNVKVDFVHPWVGELKIDLVNPQGQRVRLIEEQGGTQLHDGQVTFDDEAGMTISSASPPFTSTYRPEESLTAFDGQSIAGEWQLVIIDAPPPPPSPPGQLSGWEIEAVIGQRGVQTSTQTTNVFQWDVPGSGVLGQSDNVVFRMRAVPTVTITANDVPGPFLYGSYGANSYPFRLRGNQVRVLSGTTPISNALVYRLPAGDSTGGSLIADDTGTPFRTNADGYLEGRGEIETGDQLLALAEQSLPVEYTDRFSDTIHLYYTNGTPTETGLETFTVTGDGVQELVVSADNPLLMFDLDVSLEWDSSYDSSYLDQLEFDLKKASQYLFDFTDGQLTLGEVTVSQNADDWDYAHVDVHASNRLRPYATIGGMVVTDTADLDFDVDITYSIGQVHMGATWNRYGNPTESLGVDWPLILAHELGHFLLFLDDTYLGLNEEELLIAVDECTGSAMGDVYSVDNTEFVVSDDWLPKCEDTLAHLEIGRSEWETIGLWYPWLNTPASANSGPNQMPYDLTSVEILDPITPTDALEDPTFYLDYADSEVSSSEARAFLFRNAAGTSANGVDEYEYVYDLGSPIGGQNRLLARGTAPGDRLCVFDQSEAQYGCEIVAEGDERLGLEKDETWTPVVQISPVNSTTFTIQVDSLPTTLTLKARLYPEFGEGTGEITLVELDGVYNGTINLDEAALYGDLQLWVDETAEENNSRRETVVAYSIGGNPGNSRSGGGNSRSGGGNSRSGGGNSRSGGGNSRSGGAPAVSPDGQMIFFDNHDITFEEGQFYTVQNMAGLPELPTDKIAIGQGYNLFATGFADEDVLLDGSISFQYLGNDVLVEGKSEDELAIHFWDGNLWQTLDTYRDTTYNLASAPSQGPGVYALLAGTTTPVITAVTPSRAIVSDTTVLTITGGYFLEPVTLTLTPVGKTTTYNVPVQSVSPYSVTAMITPGMLLPAREYEVWLSNGNQPLGAASSPTPGSFALFDFSDGCFYDLFESGAGKWESDGDWGIVILPNGERAMTDSPNESYKDAANYGVGVISYTTYITSEVFSLNSCLSPTLSFEHDYTIAKIDDSQDVGRVEIWEENSGNWTELASYSGGGLFDTLGVQDVSSTEWVDFQDPENRTEIDIDLSAYTGTVRLRFSLEVNDDAFSSYGWIFDNVVVQSETGTSETENYQVFLPIILKAE